MKHNFPSNWRISSFKDVAEVITGTTPSTKHPEYYGGSIPFVGPAELGTAKPITKASKYLSLAGGKKSRLLPPESVLVCCIGTIGKVGFSGVELATNQQINSLNFDKSIVYPKYAFYYCQTLGELIRHIGASTTLPILSKGRFQNLQIPLPPIEEQRRIAAILDKADEIRRKRQEAIALTDELLRSTFLEMFGDPDEKAWEMTTVKGVAKCQKNSIRTGPFGSKLLHSEFTTEGIAVLGIDNAVKNEFTWAKPRFISPEKYGQLKSYRVFPEDVIITIMGTCGRCAIVPKDCPVAINTKHLCCITLDKSKCLPDFLHSYFLFHPTARQYLTKNLKGAIMDGLNATIIKGLPVPMASTHLQDQYRTTKLKIEKLASEKKNHLQQSNNLFNSLLQKAFKGEL